MTKGEGLVGLLYAVKDLFNAFAMMIITGVAVIAFFTVMVKFIGTKAGFFKGGNSGWLTGGGSKINSTTIMYSLFVLFVIFSVYSLIALTASIFGVNSSPTGGLLVR
jgi:hypothetical protein